MRNTWIASIVGVAVAIAAIVFGMTRGGVPDDAAFVYEDRTVTIDQLERRIDALRALYGITAPTEGSERDQFLRDAAKSYALTLILDDEAADRDISVSDKRARDLLDKFVGETFGTREEFVAALGNVRTSEAAVLEEISRQELTRLLRADVVGQVEVSDEQLRSEFDERKDELATPEQRRLNNIVVADEAAAQAALKRLQDGDAVKDVAADVSIDEATRDTAGDLGWVASNQLDQGVGRAAFEVDKGATYGPVQSQFGWNVGVVSDVREPVPADFAIVAEQFRQQLVLEEGAERWSDFLSEAMSEASVRYADDYRPDDPESPSQQFEPTPGDPQQPQPSTTPEAP